MIARIAMEAGGTLLVLFGLREVFRDIFQPTRSGILSDYVGRFMSLLMRHTRSRPAVGPNSLVTVILCWVTFLATGFALIYCGLLHLQVTLGDLARLLPSHVLETESTDPQQVFLALQRREQ